MYASSSSSSAATTVETAAATTALLTVAVEKFKNHTTNHGFCKLNQWRWWKLCSTIHTSTFELMPQTLGTKDVIERNRIHSNASGRILLRCRATKDNNKTSVAKNNFITIGYRHQHCCCCCCFYSGSGDTGDRGGGSNMVDCCLLFGIMIDLSSLLLLSSCVCCLFVVYDVVLSVIYKIKFPFIDKSLLLIKWKAIYP